MDKVKQFREYTRELELHLDNINDTDCCECGVNKGQCFMVVEIGRHPGICLKELAEILRLDKSGISRGLEELVQKGYVNREPSKEDRRSVVLTLTKEGQERFEKIETDMNIKFEVIFSKIDKDKQDQVLEGLKIYNEACRIAEKRDCCCCKESKCCD